MENRTENELLIPFIKLPKREMSDNEASVLITLLTQTNDQVKNGYIAMLKDDSAWKEQAIELNVMKTLQTNAEERVRFFIAYLCADSGFGFPLLIYYYIKLWNRDRKYKVITLEIFCQEIFPFGFPSKEDVNRLWDATKVDGIPLLNLPQFSKSIYE